MNVNPDPATYKNNIGEYRFLQRSLMRDCANLKDCDLKPLREIKRWEEVNIIHIIEESGRWRGKAADGGCNL